METSVLVRVSGLRHILQFLIQFGTSIVVARTLSPEEIGTFSIAMASVVLATTLRAGSINTYLIQHRDLQREHVASALGLTITFCAVLGAVVLLISPYVADFYGAPAIEPILWLASITFFLTPLQAVATGLLSRALQVGKLALAGLCATGTAAVVTITLAMHDFGPISMAWGAVCNAVISVTILSVLARHSLFAAWPRFFDGWREIWSITSWALLMSLIDQFSDRLTELVTGKTLSITDAALIERAATLPRMLWQHMMPPVLTVLVPLVAHELRSGENLQHIVVRRMRYFGCVFVPILAGMASQSEHLLLGIYGDNWGGAVEPGIWLCLAAGVAGQFVIIRSVMLSMGHTRPAAITTVAVFILRIAVLSVTSTISIVAVAIGMLAIAPINAAIIVMVASRHGIIRLADIPRALVPGIVTGSAAFAVGWLLDIGLSAYADLSHLATLAVVVAVEAVVLVLLLMVVEPDVLRYLRKVTGAA